MDENIGVFVYETHQHLHFLLDNLISPWNIHLLAGEKIYPCNLKIFLHCSFSRFSLLTWAWLRENSISNKTHFPCTPGSDWRWIVFRKQAESEKQFTQCIHPLKACLGCMSFSLFCSLHKALAHLQVGNFLLLKKSREKSFPLSALLRFPAFVKRLLWT